MKNDRARGGLVYSTENGQMCPACRKPVGLCDCDRKKTGPASDGAVRVSRETKGRNGKVVTVVKGLGLDDAALAQLGRELRAACGAGGTAKENVIEVQGDHCERVIDLLRKQGRNVKRIGG